MLWFLLWFALIAGALAVFALLGLRLWRQAKVLTSELRTASERLAQVSAAMTDRASPAARTEPDSTDRR